MKKILIIILMLFLINGKTSVTIPAKKHTVFNEAGSKLTPEIITSGVDKGKQKITLRYSDVNYYGADNCNEAIELYFPYHPGQTKTRLWDASEKRYISGGDLNYIVSGQGFDATVRVEAWLGGATCTNVANNNKVENYKAFYEKLTGINVEGTPLKIVLSMYQLDGDTTYLLKYGGDTPNITNATNKLVLDFKIDQAWHDANTLDTVYAANKPSSRYEALGTRGDYFTDFEDCPTIDASGKPVAKNFYIGVYYDSEAGKGTDIGDTEVFELGGRNVISGSFYLIQQVLIANSKSACLKPSINKLTNNFEYTLINLNDPFGINKFGKGETDEESLADKYYYNFSAYAPPVKFSNIFSAGRDLGGIVIDYSGDADRAKLNELKAWANKNDQDKIKIGECTSDFKNLITSSVKNGQIC